MSYMTYGQDPRRFNFITDELVRQLRIEDPNETTRVQAKAYRLLQPVLINYGQRGLLVCRAVLDALSQAGVVAHPYKQMREATARLLVIVHEVCTAVDVSML